MSDEVASLVCNVCGAELKATPETLVKVCDYCGALNIVSGVLEREDISVVPSVGEEVVLRKFWERVRGDSDLRGIADKLKVVSVEGRFIPFWLSRCKVRGEVIYTVKEYSGNKVRVVRKKARFLKSINVKIVGRRQVAHVGLDELASRYLATRPKASPLSKLDEDWWRGNRLKILSMEFDRLEAEKIIMEDSIDHVRGIWERRADRIEFFAADVVEMEKPKLILLPLWEIIYEFRGSLYFAYHEGWSGRPILFAEPMITRRRMMYLGGMILSVLGGAGIGAVISLIMEPGESGDLLGPILLGLAVLGILGYKSAKGFVSDVRVERQ